MMDNSSDYDREDLENIISYVKDKKFIPFIGPIASLLHRENAAVWNMIALRMRYLLEKGGLVEEKNYLESLAAAQEIDLKDETLAVSENQMRSEEWQQGDAIFRLQVQLTKLASRLVGLFGEQIKENRSCVVSIYDYKVPLPFHNTDKMKDLLDILELLVEEAREIAENEKKLDLDDSQPDLMAEAIYQKLLILAFRLNGKLIYEPAGRAFREEHSDQIKSLKGIDSLKQRHSLRLDELAWLEDLLWHTLRFDIPVYLSPSELTFRLSLSIRMKELRRSELPQVAELQKFKGELQNEETTQNLVRILCFCETRNDFVPDFHRVIAAAMWDQYLAYKITVGKTDALEQSSLVIPIIITTNFDRLIEEAFIKLHKSFELVYPVWVITESKEAETTRKMEWYICTYTPKPNRRDYQTSTPVICSDYEKWPESKLKTLKGPIVIKLHGSPLEGPLPEPERPNQRVEHTIILTESDYFATVVQHADDKSIYPVWLEKFLRDSKKNYWWFMGYTGDDWFVRMRIYKYLSYLNVGDRIAGAMADFFDPVRSVLFKTQGVDKVKKDLDSIAKTLRLEIDSIRKSVEEAEGE